MLKDASHGNSRRAGPPPFLRCFFWVQSLGTKAFIEVGLEGGRGRGKEGGRAVGSILIDAEEDDEEARVTIIC